MKFLKCKSCNHQNAITSAYLVFCTNCTCKLQNNFVDWKKANHNNDFKSYMNIIGTDYIELKIVKKGLTKKTKLFIAAICIQVLVFGTILSLENIELLNVQKTVSKEYLKEIKWHNTNIGNEINISLPFELNNAETTVAPYNTNNLEYLKSKRAETTCQSFSITIEEIKMIDGYILTDLDLISIKDEYQQSGTQQIIDTENNMRLKIKKYNTFLEHGFYTYDNKNYVYDNYTLIKNNKAYKIMMSYLQNDELISHMADVVNHSILNNAIIKS